MVNKNILGARFVDFFVVTRLFDLTSVIAKMLKLKIQKFKAIRLSQLSNHF